MGYIIAQDYLKQIQEGQLAQILTNNPAAQSSAELTAEAEAKSYLIQKYLVDQEFSSLTRYNPSNSYYAQDRVYLDSAPYSATNQYGIGELTLYEGNVFIATAGSTNIPFNQSNWDILGYQYQMFYGSFPNPLFDLYKIYSVGNVIYFNGHNYKALQNSIIPTPSIQYVNYENIPYPNIIPGTNAAYWQDMGAYSIPVANNILNTTYWTAGDSRDPQLLTYVIDICLYHLHSRIAPNNIPILRTNRYMGIPEDRVEAKDRIIFPVYSALGWLQAAGEGHITPNIPKIQPSKGKRVRWGGAIKTQNSY